MILPITGNFSSVRDSLGLFISAFELIDLYSPNFIPANFALWLHTHSASLIEFKFCQPCQAVAFSWQLTHSYEHNPPYFDSSQAHFSSIPSFPSPHPFTCSSEPPNFSVCE